MTQTARAATPSVEQALKLTPVQQGIDYDRPSDPAKCKIVAKRINGHVGWIVESPASVVLRRFVDTNGDNIVDQWSYYKDGLEVYRDIDANFNGKADQHRWFHTAGSRWGMDAKEDGTINAWKVISAEEASAEVVAAIATRDVRRFTCLLLTPSEVQALGLGKSRTAAITEKIGRASAEFRTMSARQSAIGPDSVWVQFSASRPGVVPAGTDQSTHDVRVYENAIAIVESGGKHVQLHLGTLVQAGDAWRVIDVPQIPNEGQADAASSNGFFFQTAMTSRGETTSPNAPSEAMQKLLADLESIDRDAARSTPEEQNQYTNRRAELLTQIALAAKTPDERALWVRQLADMISAAVQAGNCTDGAERLKALFEKLQKNPADKNLAAYVKFRQLMAGYVQSMQAPKADFSKIQNEWLKTLEQYVSDYPTAPDAAEAMLQLAISQEFAGQEDEAQRWYARIVAEFPASAAAKKAAGAQTRLSSVGKVIELAGQSPQGSTVDVANYRGKVVVVQYWATWSQPAKTDMATLKELWNKYGRSLAIVGVSLDNNVKDLNAYLSDNPLPWPQIYEEGGLDSRPANVLGILTVPTIMLIDQNGKVVNRNLTAADLEGELKKLIR